MERDTFINLQSLAQQTGLPQAWLKAEAEAGRIPSLRVRRRLMFHPEAVKQVLVERATEGVKA